MKLQEIKNVILSQEEEKIKGKKIRFVPLWKWLLS